MTRSLALLTATILVLAGAPLQPVHGGERPKEVRLVPRIGPYLWLVEEYMPTAWFGRYFETGALVSRDIWLVVADIGDGATNKIVVLVDHPIACDGDRCDVFVFAPDFDDQDFDGPSYWHLIKYRRVQVKRSLQERFVVWNDRTIWFPNNWTVVQTRLNNMPLFDFVADVYGTPVDWDEILLSHVRVGTYDLNDDGVDEVFIYVVSPPICGRDECGGAILQLLPSENGSRPGWRWIGELHSLDPATSLRVGDDISSWPGRTMRVIDETVEGYHSLCSRGSYLRWNGDSYDIDFSMSRDEAAALGCPHVADFLDKPDSSSQQP